MEKFVALVAFSFKGVNVKAGTIVTRDNLGLKDVDVDTLLWLGRITPEDSNYTRVLKTESFTIGTRAAVATNENFLYEDKQALFELQEKAEKEEYVKKFEDFVEKSKEPVKKTKSEPVVEDEVDEVSAIPTLPEFPITPVTASAVFEDEVVEDVDEVSESEDLADESEAATEVTESESTKTKSADTGKRKYNKKKRV